MSPIAIFISFSLFFTAAFAQSTPEAPKVGFKGNRRLLTKQNPFTRNCEGAKVLPTISTPNLRVDADVESGFYLVTFRFRSSAKVSLKLSGDRVQPLSRSQTGEYHLSLSRAPSGGSIQLDLILEHLGESTEFHLVADEEGTTATLMPVLSATQHQNICIRNQIWAGVGTSMFSYKQKIPDRDASAEFTSYSEPSFHLEGRWYPLSWVGVIASYKNAPGEIKSGQVLNVEQTKFNWKIFEVAGQFRKPDWLIEKAGLLVYPYIRTGLQQHWMQRIGVDAGNNVFFQDYKLLDVAFGSGVNIFTKNDYFFEVYMNYKFPISENNIAVTPTLMFDGAIGGGRQLSKNLVAGVFWYGHWDQYSYAAANTRDPSSGDIRFIFSNLDIRIGYLF